MKRWLFLRFAVLTLTVLLSKDVDAFAPSSRCIQTVTVRNVKESVQEEQETKPCFYRAPEDGQWKPRINVQDVSIGQALTGTVVQELLQGKTGPKLFFDCGVGRIDHNGDWQICNGMMRLGDKRSKQSVARKRATRLRRKDAVELVVSRVYPQSARFEVVTAETTLPQQRTLIPASTLQPGQELVGSVTKIFPFGVFVDVGANRSGLLHIQKVADLYQRYIDKEKGLEEAGLERGARIRVAVLSNERKRLFLDFTDDVKQAALQEHGEQEAALRQQQQEEEASTSATLDSSTSSFSNGNLSEEEAAVWAAYAGMPDESEEEYLEQDDDGYDEDRDIEDALGLGSY